jgi:hypothetical protein
LLHLAAKSSYPPVREQKCKYCPLRNGMIAGGVNVMFSASYYQQPILQNPAYTLQWERAIVEKLLTKMAARDLSFVLRGQ